MREVSVRELRNAGGEILDAVMRGATMTVTRQGRPIAELRPLRTGTEASALLASWRGTPTFELSDLRADLAKILDDRL